MNRGEPSFLNSVSRRDLAGFLLLTQSQGHISNDQMLQTYFLMTDGVKAPKKGVDQASFWHDKYSGSNPADPNSRRANNKWVKDAWKRARGPGDIAAAALGTVLFKTTNFVHDITRVKPARYRKLSCPKCKIKL